MKLAQNIQIFPEKKNIFRIHVKQQFRRMPFMPMFNQCPYHLLLDKFWVGWHDVFMGKILGSQTVDGYVLMAGEKV